MHFNSGLTKFAFGLAAAALCSVSLTGCGDGKDEAAASGMTVVKVGVVGDYNAQWDTVNEILKKDKITIKPLRVFNNKNKLKSMKDVKDGDIFAIPSDLTNGGRALKVLEAAGLIVCDPAKGYVPTKTDIIKYNVKIEIREAESGVLYNILPDVSAALINGGNAYTAGLDAVKDSIFAENINAKENPNVGQLYNVIVARSKDKDNPVYKKVVDAYHTQQTAKTLMDVYKGAFTPVWAGSENYKY